MITRDEIKIRNKSIVKFFKYNGYDVELSGNENNPMIVLNNSIRLKCWVHNFVINFSNAHKEGETLFSIRISRDDYKKFKHDSEQLEEFIKKEIKEWFASKSNAVYRIGVKNSDLVLTGFQYKHNIKTDSEEDKKPVFGLFNPYYFIRKSYAEQIIGRYSNDKLKLELL